MSERSTVLKPALILSIGILSFNVLEIEFCKMIETAIKHTFMWNSVPFEIGGMAFTIVMHRIGRVACSDRVACLALRPFVSSSSLSVGYMSLSSFCHLCMKRAQS